MQLEWELREEYADIGGTGLLQESMDEALAVLPREHLRQLAVMRVQDEDPRGKALGIWRQDHRGVGIELYALPHVRPLLMLPPAVREFALRLHLAYTLFHEVGHHVTRFLNKRTAPPRKAALVEQKIERWADEYAEKRLVKLTERWLKPGGLAETPEARAALEAAVKAMRLTKIVTLGGGGNISGGPGVVSGGNGLSVNGDAGRFPLPWPARPVTIDRQKTPPVHDVSEAFFDDKRGMSDTEGVEL